jgi:hypothetical protein
MVTAMALSSGVCRGEIAAFAAGPDGGRELCEGPDGGRVDGVAATGMRGDSAPVDDGDD